MITRSKPRLSSLAALLAGIACIVAVCAAATARAESPADARYAEVDRHALDAPKSAEQGVQSLAAYLTAPAQNESEKARAIFCWVAHNITYDSEKLPVQRGSRQSADAVLKGRVAVCFGYAGLFADLARAAGLEVAEITGHAKGYGYAVGAKFDGPPNHAWSAVKMDGRWRQIDCTWGAGHMDEQGRYVRRYDDHYFATPPGEFVYDHFPEDPKWQLLETPISRDEYERQPLIRPPFFKYDLGFASHHDGLIKTRAPISVSLTSPPDCIVLARLFEKGQKLAKTCTLVQREDGVHRVYASFPHAGSYVLSIYAKRKGDPEGCEWALDYLIEAGSGSADASGYPECLSGFIERGVRLYSPMSANLEIGTKETFKLDVPGAKEVAVIVGNEWRFLKGDASSFAGEVSIISQPVKVCARFGEPNVFDVLLEYGAQ